MFDFQTWQISVKLSKQDDGCLTGPTPPNFNLSYLLTGYDCQPPPECVFPFTYKGVKYSECIDIDHDQAWCATVPFYEQNVANFRNCLCKYVYC